MKNYGILQEESHTIGLLSILIDKYVIFAFFEFQQLQESANAVMSEQKSSNVFQIHSLFLKHSFLILPLNFRLQK